MTITTYGRAMTTAGILLLVVLLAAARAHADTYWAKDISISNILAAPTPAGADVAHVRLVLSNTGTEDDVLLYADVPKSVAGGAGFDALPTTVYRGGLSIRRAAPVFLSAGQTRLMGFSETHLILYGIQGALTNGLAFPMRLTFEKAGAVDIVVEVGRSHDDTAFLPRVRLASFEDEQGPDARSETLQTRAAFSCQDGSRLLLGFDDAGGVLSALVSVQGATYRLPALPPEPGPVQIVWSDGAHSLTWSPGVRLMWMSASSHLMCGRSHTH